MTERIEINILPVDDQGVRWVYLQTPESLRCLGGYQVHSSASPAVGEQDSLRFALGMAQAYQRTKARGAVIVVRAGL